MKVHPLHDRVLLKRLEEQEVKRGGIIIPDTAKEKPQEAEIIEAGKGRVNDEGKTIPLVVPSWMNSLELPALSLPQPKSEGRCRGTGSQPIMFCQVSMTLTSVGRTDGFSAIHL